MTDLGTGLRARLDDTGTLDRNAALSGQRELRVKAFETAIRKALQKVDNADPKLRERIYQSARDALTNSQAKQGVWGTDTATAQNRRLEELIESIDVEYRMSDQPGPRPDPEPRAPTPEPRAPAAESEARRPRKVQRTEPPPMRTEPEVQRQPRSEKVQWTEPAPVSMEEVPQTGHIEPERREAPTGKKTGKRRRQRKADPDLLGADGGASAKGKSRKKRRRPVFSIMLVISLVIAFVGIGVLWIVFTGLFQSSEQRDTSVPNPPATVDGGDFAGNPLSDGSFSGDWIEVFAPSDVSRVARRGNAKAALVESGGRQALQIVSPDAGADSEVLFELSPNILADLAGRQSLVAVTLRASADTPTQIYIKCMLPAGESCGRHRFDVNYESSDVVFSLNLPGRAADGNPGYLALNSDVAGTGHGVDVFAIRIRPQ